MRRYVLAHQMFIDHSPPQLVQLAAAAGYDSVTLRLRPARQEAPYDMLGNQSPFMRETLARLADSSVTVHTIEVVRIKPELEISDLESLFDASARLGAQYLNLISDDPDIPRVTEKVAAIEERLKPLRMHVGLEFIVYTGIKTVAQAMQVLHGAGPDCKLVPDALHLHRSGGTPKDLATVRPDRMPCIQVCDAMLEPLPDSGGVGLEAVAHRLLPLRGQLPLVELLQAAPAHCDLVVEAPDQAMRRQHTAHDIATLAMRLTRELVQRADTEA